MVREFYWRTSNLGVSDMYCDVREKGACKEMATFWHLLRSGMRRLRFYFGHPRSKSECVPKPALHDHFLHRDEAYVVMKILLRAKEKKHCERCHQLKVYFVKDELRTKTSASMQGTLYKKKKIE